MYPRGACGAVDSTGQRSQNHGVIGQNLKNAPTTAPSTANDTVLRRPS